MYRDKYRPHWPCKYRYPYTWLAQQMGWEKRICREFVEEPFDDDLKRVATMGTEIYVFKLGRVAPTYNIMSIYSFC